MGQGLAYWCIEGVGCFMGQVIQLAAAEPLIDHRHRDYQAAEIRRIIAGESRLLLHGVGAGKTTTILHGIQSATDVGLIARTILFSTGAIIRGVWGQEIGEWPLLNRTQYRIIHGNPATRLRQVREALAIPGVIIGVPFDLIQWFESSCQEALAEPYAMVMDEISVIRNARGKRFKAAKRIAAGAKIRIGLTGSPTPNRVSELYGPVSLVDLGQRFGTSISRFEAAVLVRYGKKPWQVKDRPEVREKILKTIADLCSVIRTEDVAEIPEISIRNVEVQLPDKAMELYEQMAAGWDPIFNREIHEDAIAVALQQVCNGWRYDENGENPLHVHDAKFDALCDIVDGLLADDRQVMALYQFQGDRDRILAKYPHASVINAGADVGGIIERWNKGELSLILAHPRSCGHGLNLQRAPRGGFQIWMAATWSSELWEQTLGRIHRPGAVHHKVVVYVLVAAGTIDDAVVNVMRQKIKVQDAVKMYLAEKRAQKQAPDLAATLREARAEVQRSHPDKGGSDAAFQAAWRRYQNLRSLVEA